MTLRTLLVKLGFKGDIKGITNFDNKITGLKTNILGLSAIFASTTAALGYFLNEAAKLEQTKIAFEVMTNSVQLGQKLIKDLFRFARTTPFQIPGVLQASKILLAMGITAEEQIDVLTKIGHVAAGINKPLDQLASIFGRVRAAGYLTGYEMERLRRAGVPLGAYLSELLKRPEKDILQMIRRKEISFEMFAEGWELMVKKRFPNLMGKLLLTFKGITSNIKDYIYEIVAFSGEELLPVFKLMANQLENLLDTSRELIGLKFKQFFGGISSALILINKGFIKLYFRTRETVTQFGGINRIFKVFITLFGTFVGMKSLALLGRIGKIVFSLLSFASLKLVLIGVAMIGIFAVTEDLLGFLVGKKSVFEDILNMIENRFPIAFEHIEKWLKILKKEIEGLSLIAVGLFEGIMTGDWSMAKAGMEQVSEAYRMALTKVKKVTPGVDPFAGDIDIEGMTAIEGTIAMSPLLRKIAELTEKAKIAVDKLFQPAGSPTPIQIGPKIKRNILPPFTSPVKDYEFPVSPKEYIKKTFGPMIESITRDAQMLKYQYERKAILREKMLPERLLIKGKQLREGLNINMPVAIEFKNLPEKVDKERIVKEIKNTLNDVVTKNLDNRLKAEYSAVQPEQE